MTPDSAKSLATSPMRRMFSSRSSALRQVGREQVGTERVITIFLSKRQTAYDSIRCGKWPLKAIANSERYHRRSPPRLT